ncbi:uncharacterized protein PRCAT00001470001 [Priceomyces carsonii]|uniref:uncharacterized protein n=1 Tax=Priceomyces carsonii TaxID=28549 RepID=UPI002EDBA636|nr:unnamed protein product [Priceomyces carsonii]
MSVNQSLTDVSAPEKKTISSANSEEVEKAENKKSRWTRFLEFIWDGPRSKEEKKYIQKLDLFLLTWGW